MKKLILVLFLLPTLLFGQIQSVFVKYTDMSYFPTMGNTKAIYLDLSTNKIYQFDGTNYVKMSISATLTDNSDGTVTIEGENKEKAIRPINELSEKLSIDVTNDYIPIFDSNTGDIMRINKTTFADNEILYSNVPLSGQAPNGKELGINTSTGEFYFKDANGNWQLQPLGTTVNIIINTDGTTTINAGLGGIEKVQTPLNALQSTTNIKGTDKLLMYNDTSHVAITQSTLSNSIISKEPVEYDNHYLLGRKAATSIGYNLALFFTNNYTIVVSDINTSTSTNDNYTDIGMFITDLNNLVASISNSTVYSYEKIGANYVVYSNNIQNNLQIAIRDNNTGNWLNTANSSDPEADGIEGEVPYTVTPLLSVSEPIIVNNDTCTYSDKVFFVRDVVGDTLNDIYFGWSYPENTGWSNTPSFSNTYTYDLYIDLETDNIGQNTYQITGQNYSSFKDLMEWFNSQLLIYGSSFRLESIGNDRVLVTDINSNILLSNDPYFINNSYTYITLEIKMNGSTFLIKGEKAQDLTLTNVITDSQIKLYKGILPTDTTDWNLQGNQNITNSFLGSVDTSALSIRTNSNEMIKVGLSDIDFGSNNNSITNINNKAADIIYHNLMCQNNTAGAISQYYASIPTNGVLLSATGAGYNGFTGSASSALLSSIASPLILQAFGGAAPYIDFKIGNGAQAMRIASSRNVLISTIMTNAPVQQLDIRSSVNSLPNPTGVAKDGTLRVENLTSTLALDFGSSATATWLQSRSKADYSVKGSLLVNPNGGNVGIGLTAPTSSLHLVGSYATNATVIAATYTVLATDNTIICNNAATAITITLPNPTTCLGREINISRYAGSTGTVTITNTGTASVQALAGTLGATTSLATLGSNGQNVCFKAVTVGAVTSWLRIK